MSIKIYTTISLILINDQDQFSLDSLLEYSTSGLLIHHMGAFIVGMMGWENRGASLN